MLITCIHVYIIHTHMLTLTHAHIYYTAGVTTIVCLMPEEELALFRPYKEIAMQYAAQEMRTVAFLSFPIAGEKYHTTAGVSILAH